MNREQLQRTKDILNVVLHKDATTKFERDNINELIKTINNELKR